MTPVGQALLEVDVAVMRLANTLGRSDRGNEIRDKLKDLRRAAAKAKIRDLADHLCDIEPEEAVKRAVQYALEAGIEFPTIVGAVNSVSERRFGGGEPQ